MGSSASALPPPPGADQSSSQPTTPTAPEAASPSPAQPSPAMQQGTQLVISIVNNLRSIAKSYPEAAPKVAEANNIMREIMAALMQHQNPGEPAAPPA
jgi:hypothetical protein